MTYEYKHGKKWTSRDQVHEQPRHRYVNRISQAIKISNSSTDSHIYNAKLDGLLQLDPRITREKLLSSEKQLPAATDDVRYRLKTRARRQLQKLSRERGQIGRRMKGKVRSGHTLRCKSALSSDRSGPDKQQSKEKQQTGKGGERKRVRWWVIKGDSTVLA